ncbi:hypothetical protein [Geothrix sp. SG200]|uniref:P-loop ATPase, Sll1717 family n=1 Tax=Geothrix sp. SG200 TaxID=2922865 RepID=UPI001FABEC2A|nr:hypothetical protein [Geothrix sp. SG200]
MSSKSVPEKSPFKFRRNDSIGATDADDDSLLEDCFVDTGVTEVLMDTLDAKRLIVGRTGAGKTALIRRISESTERSIYLLPDSLALSYISNSTILRYLHSLGVKLDIFYKLLWRHVFAIELIKRHFHIMDQQSKETVVDKIKGMFRNKKHDRVLSYLENWGQSFWLQTDYRVQEITEKLELELKASIQSMIPGFKFESSASGKSTEEEKIEIIHRAQEVINKVQIQELAKIIELIDDILSDPQIKYYILIDKLDEQWVDDGLKNYLIRALIETVRDFKRIHNAKIIIAIRRDLLDRVYQHTRDSGFQEEKYESLYLDLVWKKEELEQILDSRVNQLIRSRYTTARISYRDILPQKHLGKKVIDYICEISLMRPRDVIMFFNICIQKADGRSTINTQILQDAEGEYSRNRLRSLADEWSADYPNLLTFSSILKNRPSAFPVSEIFVNQCEDIVLDFLTTMPDHKVDCISELAKKYTEGTIDVFRFKREILTIFYRVGLIGLKIDSYDSIAWSTIGARTVSVSEINEQTRIYVHRCFWRVLGIREPNLK